MKTKTFNIGEYCAGGTLQIVVKKEYVTINCLEYKTKTLYQSRNFARSDFNAMEFFLSDLTTCYYTDKVINYIKSINQ